MAAFVTSKTPVVPDFANFPKNRWSKIGVIRRGKIDLGLVYSLTETSQLQCARAGAETVSKDISGLPDPVSGRDQLR